MRRILFATDASPSALRAAAWLGEQWNAAAQLQVTLIYIIPAPGEVYAVGLSDGPLPEGDPAAAPFRHRAEEAFRQTLRAIGVSAEQVALRSEIGEPGKAICRIAAEVGADAVLLGRRGLGPAQAILLGSVSEWVLAHAPCPVIVVR